jgi:hypothetical protein
MKTAKKTSEKRGGRSHIGPGLLYELFDNLPASKTNGRITGVPVVDRLAIEGRVDFWGHFFSNLLRYGQVRITRRSITYKGRKRQVVYLGLVV